MFELVSYLMSALAFLVVLVLTLVAWKGRFLGLWLVQALVFTVVWSLYLAFSTWSEPAAASNQVFLEILRDASWILFIWKLHTFNQGEASSRFWQHRYVRLFLVSVVIFLLLNLVQSSLYPLPGWLPDVQYLAPFCLSIFAIFILEQWYRNIAPDQRWGVKFLAVGLVVMFGYDLVLYSEALLHSSPDSVLWQTRGWIVAMTAPFVALSIARSKDWDQPIRISHQAALYTTGVFLTGIYLLCLALIGYYVRWFGTDTGWGNTLQIIFMALGLSFLALLIGSGRVRSLISVWLNKHFFTYKYDYREQWMRGNARLASLPVDDTYYQQLIYTITEPFDSPGGALWTKSDTGFAFKAGWGGPRLPDLLLDTDDSFLSFCADRGWVIELDELRENPGMYEGLSMPGWMLNNGQIWTLVPLLYQDEMYGLVGLYHPRAQRSINWEDRDLFKALGGQIASLIALRDANEALTEARQFEAYNRLSAFVVHDLKNIMAQLSLVVTNAERHKTNPEFVDDALATLDNAVQRMNRLLSQLRQESQLNVTHEVVNCAQIVADVQNHQKQNKPVPVLTQVTENLYIRVEHERCVSVLCHLVQNAQEATPDDGVVEIGVQAHKDQALFTIRDSGSGMDESFIRDRLFKPFDTTKGRAGMGIGVYETQQFVRAAGGHVDVMSQPGVGTTFKVYLPLHQKTQQSVDSEGTAGSEEIVL